ncbi:MAG: alpha/beta hydrolase [Actinomycetota bacterium]
MITDLARTFDVDNVALAWDRWGDASGVPLLLCHGFSGSAHDFALQIEQLASRRGVVALDHRGHGQSEKVRHESGYSIDRLASDLIALVDAKVGGPVDLLGHSMGGAISLRVALERPDLVRSLILMDTSAWQFAPDDPAMKAMFTQFFAGYDPAHGLPDLSALAGPETALIERATPLDWQAIKADQDAAFDPWAMKALGRCLFDDATISVRDRLPSIACPVTVIVGELDEPFAKQAPALAAEVPQGHLSVIGGAYHSPQLTHSDAWLAALEGHLARV